MLGIFATYWLGSVAIGLTIGLTMLINLTLAPTLAVFIPSIFYREHADPALGAGPVATIIQDLLIYSNRRLLSNAIALNRRRWVILNTVQERS